MEIEGTTVPSGTQADETAPGGNLGKDEFLRLLITQLSNQDPLDPMDSQATIAQLAQFSSLEQMNNLNVQFEGFRKEMNLTESLLLGGEEVKMVLEDDMEVQGKVDKVSWDTNGMLITINGIEYPVNDVISIRKVQTPTP